MNPLPGYRFANWDTGYGDVVVPSRLRHGPAHPVAPGHRHGHRRPDRRGRRRRSRCRPARSCAASSSGRPSAGFACCSATELEFFLFRDTYEEADAKGWQGLAPHTSTIEDYQLLQTSREEYVLRRIRNEMCGAGIPVEFSKGEAGRGQHEVNVTYAEALETADRHLVFKNGIKEIAAQEGRAATFMAKWTMDDVGSSCHVHTQPVGR